MDPTPTSQENHLYTTQEIRLLFREQMIFSIGSSLGILFAGGILTLGVLSFFLLSSEGKEGSKQQLFLRIYVVIVSVFVLAHQVSTFIIGYNFAFAQSFGGLVQNVEYSLSITNSFIPLIIGGMTDGLLVWRCIMVQKALGSNNPKLRKLFRIVPISLWIITMVTGFAGGGLVCLWRCPTLPWCMKWIDILQSTAIASNVILNVFATFYIVIRLLLLRRALISLYGKQISTVQHLCIAGILLESATINVPVMVFLIISINMNVRTNVTPLAVTCQAFASILIIHQVAIGRAFSGRQEVCDTEKRNERMHSSQDSESIQ